MIELLRKLEQKGELHIVDCNHSDFPFLAPDNRCGRVYRHFIPAEYPKQPIQPGKSAMFELWARIRGIKISRYSTPKCYMHFSHLNKEV